MRKFAYFRCEDGFVGVTDESPKGLRGLIYAGRGPLPGQGIGSVCEQGYAINQLDMMKKIKTDDVPDDWFEAIGYEKRPEPEPEEKVTYLTIELPGDRLRRKILAKPGTKDYYRWKEERLEYVITAIIVAAIMSCLIAWGIL